MAIRTGGKIPLEVKQGKGLTREFSTSGLYFVTDQMVSVGEQVEMALLLEHVGMGRWLHFQGEVEGWNPAMKSMESPSPLLLMCSATQKEQHKHKV